jgi:hypothetical protein
MLLTVAACGEGPVALDSENAIIDPPTQCSSGRPDCSVSQDFPVGSDLNATNSAGLRFSNEANALVIDRASSLPDMDGDGVPDDADDCPGTPDWITCDNDPTNDGLYQTVFYDPSGTAEVARTSIATTTADIPQIDVYFLIDATPTLTEEIVVLQDEILLIIDDIRLSFPDAQFGLGLYREYPLAPLAPPHSQSPYHHILDLTDDDLLLQTAVSTLLNDELTNTVANMTVASAATQALYSVASGRGLGDMVPNRAPCPSTLDGDIGYPCFRAGALHVVMNITDAAVYNGPRLMGPRYDDEGFAPGAVVGVETLPPVEMFPELFGADTAALALDLGDVSGRSLTLMGMSTGLTNQVNTAVAPGCASPPPVPPDPPGLDTDDTDAVLALRFDSAVPGVTAFANNTHWPGANVALFDDPMLDPALALACDVGPGGTNHWGAISWPPVTSRQYYLVADGIVPAAEPGHKPEGAFSISIVRDGDSPNPQWRTSDAPVVWNDGVDGVEPELLASDIRVASVVTLKDALTTTSDGNDDARLIAAATEALTKVNGQWVTELPSAIGSALGAAISNTIAKAKDESVYTISMVDEDNPATTIVDERDFIAQTPRLRARGSFRVRERGGQHLHSLRPRRLAGIRGGLREHLGCADGSLSGVRLRAGCPGRRRGRGGADSSSRHGARLGLARVRRPPRIELLSQRVRQHRPLHHPARAPKVGRLDVDRKHAGGIDHRVSDPYGQLGRRPADCDSCRGRHSDRHDQQHPQPHRRADCGRTAMGPAVHPNHGHAQPVEQPA